MSNSAVRNGPGSLAETLDQNLRDKLSYDWKQIYRKLNVNDMENTGRVGIKDFKEALHQTNTFLTKEDLLKIE